MRKSLLLGSLMIIIAVSLAAYAWAAYEGAANGEDEGASSEEVRFKTTVNGMSGTDVIPFDISDGLTEEEAKLIAETTFIQIMGQTVKRRLDVLTFTDTQVEAHYTWGCDETDMGHIFSLVADLTTLRIEVTHCY